VRQAGSAAPALVTRGGTGWTTEGRARPGNRQRGTNRSCSRQAHGLRGVAARLRKSPCSEATEAPPSKSITPTKLIDYAGMAGAAPRPGRLLSPDRQPGLLTAALRAGTAQPDPGLSLGAPHPGGRFRPGRRGRDSGHLAVSKKWPAADGAFLPGCGRLVGGVRGRRRSAERALPTSLSGRRSYRSSDLPAQ
jgi:hypothetical protein